jgi:hypothetical protein
MRERDHANTEPSLAGRETTHKTIEERGAAGVLQRPERYRWVAATEASTTGS